MIQTVVTAAILYIATAFDLLVILLGLKIMITSDV
ncbi:cadmium resistance transporter [Staphylococcus aureus]|nr:cadmium resistance transporter [Staphylococcus aureus]